MKKGLLIGLLIGVVVSLGSFLAIPALAQVAGGGGGWQEMHNACQSGDWDAMRDAARRFHGDAFDQMPCGGAPGGATGASSDRGPRSGGMMGGGWSW